MEQKTRVKILVRNQLHSPKSEGMNAKTNVSNLSEGEDSGTQEKGRRKKVSLITIKTEKPKTGKPTVAFWVRVEDGTVRYGLNGRFGFKFVQFK